MWPATSWLAKTDAQKWWQPPPRVCLALPAVTLPAYHRIIMMNRPGACYRPQIAHTAQQWVAMANITTPCSLCPFIFFLFLSWCSHFFILFLVSAPVTFSITSYFSSALVSYTLSPKSLRWASPSCSVQFFSLAFVIFWCSPFFCSTSRQQAPKKESASSMHRRTLKVTMYVDSYWALKGLEKYIY